MSKKNRYRGLRFNYKINGQVLMDKYKTIEEFLNEAPTKDNPLAPKMETEIFNITWNAQKVICEVKCLHDLYDLLMISDSLLCEEGPKLQDQLSKKKRYIRKEIYDIDFVREKIKDVVFVKDKKGPDYDVDFDGDMIHGNSQRYQTFFTKGTKCACCGLEASYFAKERGENTKRYHLNLYGINSSGQEILFTKDHIVPKSKGGKDTLENYQTMCEPCNKRKGNKYDLSDKG